MRQLLHRVRSIWTVRRLDDDFDQEMAAHLDLLAEDYRRRGMSNDEATRCARVHFGGTAQLREAHRDTRGLPVLESALLDIRYALRALQKNPGFTLLALITLAIGIGVNTAVFTVYNAGMLRPLDAVDPARVVQLAHLGRNAQFSDTEYRHYRDFNGSFTGLAAATNFIFSMSSAGSPAPSANGGLTAATGLSFPRVSGGAEPVSAAVVSGNYFQLLGVPATLGRMPQAADDGPAAQPVAVLSHEFWARRFGTDPAMLTRKLRLNGIDVAVIGIAPPAFGGSMLTVPDLWVPASVVMRAAPGRQLSYLLLGRLRPGVGQAQARDELNALEATLAPSPAAPDAPRGLIVGRVNRGGQPGDRDLAGPFFLLGAVGLVLVIACANIASLLLARSAARRREIAIRLAIGASRRRLIRQLLTENAVLSIAAGVAGLVASWWILQALVQQLANSPFAHIATAALRIAPDQRVFTYVLFLSLAATFGFGLAPALDCSRPNLSAGLKDEGPAFGGHVRKSRLRDLMVGAQVAICLLLLIAAGLLTRASQRALSLDLGFDYSNIISLEVVFPAGTSSDAIRAVRTQVAQDLARLPDVQSVAVGSRLPLVHGGMRSFAVSAHGSVDAPGTQNSWYTLVTPSYFDTLGIAIVRGRNFTPQEAGDGVHYDGAPVIVSQATARKLWPGEDAIGKRLIFGPRREDGVTDDARSTSGTVVGIAKDIRAWRLDRYDDSDVYLPVAASFGGTASGNNGRPDGVIGIRARFGKSHAEAAIRQLLQTSYPDLQATIGDFQTALASQTAYVGARLGGIGAAIIGILGLLMASVGIYGTVAFAVTRRTREIGVRMALGASRKTVFAMVLTQTMRPVGIGLLVGFVLSAAVSRLIHSILFGLPVIDPVAFLGVSAILAAVALIAGCVPARRAMRVDPVIALRCD